MTPSQEPGHTFVRGNETIDKMAKRWMFPEPYDPMCKRYARDMDELDKTWAESQEDFDSVPESERPETRASFVIQEDGTYNPSNGHFLCNDCYIKAGMPSGPSGWICP